MAVIDSVVKILPNEMAFYSNDALGKFVVRCGDVLETPVCTLLFRRFLRFP